MVQRHCPGLEHELQIAMSESSDISAGVIDERQLSLFSSQDKIPKTQKDAIKIMTIWCESIIDIWQIPKGGKNRVRVDCDVKPTFLHGGGVENTAGERAVDFDDEHDGLR